MAHTPPIGYGVGMGGSGAQDPFYRIWAVAVGLHGSHGPSMGCGVGMGGSGAQDPFYRVWGVDIGLQGAHGPTYRIWGGDGKQWGSVPLIQAVGCAYRAHGSLCGP